MNRHGTPRNGFTLLELLVAGAVLTLLVTSLTVLFVRTTRAYETTASVSERAQVEEAAIQMIRYDLTLAGYRPIGEYSTAATFDSFDFPTHFSGDADSVEVTNGVSSDSILVRYFEDSGRQFASGAAVIPTQVAFSVNSTSNELRRDAGTSVTVAQGVTSLNVLRLIDENGDTVAADGSIASPDGIAAVELQLTFVDGNSRSFVVGFENRPQVTVD